jgi:hypothetical protein
LLGVGGISSLSEQLPVAGFWRRFGSGVVDYLLVFTPMQVLAVCLFLATSGHVQMDGGAIHTVRCEPISALPDNLSPDPPDNWNAAADCWTTLLGAPTAHKLSVARVTSGKSGVASYTYSVSRAYALDAKGAPIDAFALDNVAFAALALYLIAMKALRGKSLGDRLVRVRLVDVADPARVGAPAWKVVLRYLAMTLGLLPGIAWLGLLAIRYGAGAWEHVSAIDLFAFGGFFALWTLVNVVLIVRKTDPIYDAICGLSVRRV